MDTKAVEQIGQTLAQALVSLARAAQPGQPAPDPEEQELLRLKLKKSLRPPEVEKLYGYSQTCLKQWRHKKTGPAYIKEGAVIVYKQEDLEAFQASRRIRTYDQRA